MLPAVKDIYDLIFEEQFPSTGAYSEIIYCPTQFLEKDLI